ncbi:hypothetical protein BaRGS_00012721 [Batillaria attramentaria]|uniref:MYND-type domain-containing protein n=1 Tax=Batillaria attramentaria TaxID=370345 RepID=A0ABD0L9M6_9CAEN
MHPDTEKEVARGGCEGRFHADRTGGTAFTEWTRECAVCYRKGTEEEFTTCEGCQAMVYCSITCQQNDWDNGEATASFSHRHWCTRIKSYMAREQELRDLPFTFADETTHRHFHEEKLTEFLNQHGVYGKGLWRRESPLLRKNGQCRKCGYYTRHDKDTWVIASVGAVLDHPPMVPPPPPTTPLTDWSQYYSYRGLPLHCPAAAILTFPLTLYYILTTGLKSHAPDVHRLMVEGKELIIHMLGVEREVELIPAFLLTCTMFIMTGFNAGLPAYPTWPATLRKLMDQKTPAYFTDQSEYSVACVCENITNVGVAGITPVTVNPFRSPLRIVMKEQNMPWFSNAFLFTLCYNKHS